MRPQLQEQQQQTNLTPQRDLDEWFQNLQLQNPPQYYTQQLTKTFKMPPRDHHYDFFRNPQIPNLKALNQHPLSGTKKAVVAKQGIQQLQNQKTIYQRRAGPQIGRQLQPQQQASQESQETIPNSRSALQERPPVMQHTLDQNQVAQLPGEQSRQNLLRHLQNRQVAQRAQLFQVRQPQQQTGGRRIIDAQQADLEMPPEMAAYLQQNSFSHRLFSQFILSGPNNVPFNDDDQLDPPSMQRQATLAGYKLQKELNLMLKSQFQQILLNGQETIKQLPSMVALRCADLNDDGDQHLSVGVDLFCVIDTISSIRGAKIETVRESLTLLLEFLTPQDRLCLIIFSTTATRLTPLKRMTPENKAYFQECIKSQVIAFGGTKIASGTDLAFRQMRQRRYKNFVTSLLILTDGQDGSAHNMIRNQIAQCPSETFSIHTFGYGATRSIDLLTRISALGSGNCYIVENIELLGQYFADALGGLQSTVGKNVQIDVRLIPSQFTEINILKTYGAMWEEALAKRNYKIKLPYMIAGAKKEYVFELAMPTTKSKIKVPVQIPIVEASIKMISLTGAEFVQSTRLLLQFFGSPQGMPEIVEDIEVMESYARVSAAEAIDDARRACEQDKNEQAMQMLQHFRESLERNTALKQAAGQTIVDLDSAVKACDQRRFREFGAKQLQQMKWTSYIQSGVNSQFDERGVQLNSFASGYQNSKQKKMVYTIQQLQAKRI